jgi:hypothetical protein
MAFCYLPPRCGSMLADCAAILGPPINSCESVHLCRDVDPIRSDLSVSIGLDHSMRSTRGARLSEQPIMSRLGCLLWLLGNGSIKV